MKYTITAVFLVLSALMMVTGCGNSSTLPMPYEYTATNEITKITVYENERIEYADITHMADLAESGYSDVELEIREGAEGRIIQLELHDDMFSGDPHWYILNLHFLIEFEEITGNGNCQLSIEPLGSAWFETLKVNYSPYVRIGVERPVTSKSTLIDVRYLTYVMQDIHAGENKITFNVREYGNARIKSVKVFSDTGISVTLMPPYDKHPAMPEAKESFYGVSPELNARLEQICLSDPRIQELLKDRQYSLNADGQTTIIKDYNLALGARLKDGITSEQFKEWLDDGRQESDLINEYAGVLNIGYSEAYDLVIDLKNETVTEIIKENRPTSTIPELTPEEKQRAIDIAFSDETVIRLLEGKEYEIAPQGVGVWHEGETKLGAVFEIQFKQSYKINADLPSNDIGTLHYSGDATRLMISVLLDEERVANIIALDFPLPNDNAGDNR